MPGEWWRYENLPSGEPYDWGVTGGETPASRGDSEFDQIDFHIDLGCGTVPKGRLGIDRYPARGVDIVMDLERLDFMGIYMPEADDMGEVFQLEQQLYFPDGRLPGVGWLPFPDNSIHSIVSHHFFEHMGLGFPRLIDECHRILQPGGILRAITPLFPSQSAVADPDHKRFFCYGTWQSFCGTAEGDHWMQAFSVPYTSARFELLEEIGSPMNPPEQQWQSDDARELRVALRKHGG